MFENPNLYCFYSHLKIHSFRPLRGHRIVYISNFSFAVANYFINIVSSGNGGQVPKKSRISIKSTYKMYLDVRGIFLNAKIIVVKIKN